MVDDKTLLRKEYVPLFTFLVAVEHGFAHRHLTVEQKQGYLELLAECHSLLSQAIEKTKELEYIIQLDLSKGPNGKM